ncbi:Protein Wnt [Meloidogyne graminicola]|uniref:Protein Wnt n=1 Tax=Meloidogyne graminicola TaxID=189291 RepID=A0A8S9ZVA7_9BILA|nr:Protein Wnt [Meloidogyne graminicola]
MTAQLSSAISSPDYYNCQMQPGLVKHQREICAKHPAAMRAISEGLRNAIDECHIQFQRERWNCSASFEFVGPVKGAATAETAFIYAISSGGASHSLARACAKGLIPECGCGGGEQTIVTSAAPEGFNGKPEQFIWAGCSDNIKFSNQFTRKFIDSTEKQIMDARALMNLHNNRVGRRLLAANVREQCKCHGVSGSCVTKTCWRTVPKLEDLASLIKKKYQKAQQVMLASDSFTLIVDKKEKTILDGRLSQISTSIASKREQRFLKGKNKLQIAKLASKSELVFLEDSPDYCLLENNSSSGASGRECFSLEDCEQICCSKGWNTKKEIRQEPCRCKFVWCCDVKCDTCRREVIRHFCR